ncbi:unnamed protein product [Alopecurus aequalis]
MGQALRRASGRLRPPPPPPPPARPPPPPPPPRASPAAAGAGSLPQDRLDVSQDDVTTSTKDTHGVLVERDPSYDDMLKHMVGRITTKPGGKPEMGEVSTLTLHYSPGLKYHSSFDDFILLVNLHNRCIKFELSFVWGKNLIRGFCVQASVVEQYRRPLPKVRTSEPEPEQGGPRQLPPGTLNVAHIQEIIQLYQGKSSSHHGSMSVDEIASRFRVEAPVVRGIVQFVSLPQDESVEKKDEHREP